MQFKAQGERPGTADGVGVALCALAPTAAAATARTMSIIFANILKRDRFVRRGVIRLTGKGAALGRREKGRRRGHGSTCGDFYIEHQEVGRRRGKHEHG